MLKVDGGGGGVGDDSEATGRVGEGFSQKPFRGFPLVFNKNKHSFM